jgi:hypothetical protein
MRAEMFLIDSLRQAADRILLRVVDSPGARTVHEFTGRCLLDTEARARLQPVLADSRVVLRRVWLEICSRVSTFLFPDVNSRTATSLKPCSWNASSWKLYNHPSPTVGRISPKMHYSSNSRGTTGTQKCVVVTKAMLAEQLDRLSEVLAPQESDGVVSLAEAAEPAIARSPTTRRIAGSRHSRSASFTSS